YYYMLPNKFFENIQSLTPIIGSDFPEIRRIIKGYNIGLCVNPERIDEIANAIEEMRKNREMYSWFKRNLKYAKDELCWENERNVLEEAYGKILR
ncbi:MAG: group 1 glycosyl transferase, partial [Clostridia bacterium]|nr:group 1 glycosyl transferase [Clostridia bacterium]